MKLLELVLKNNIFEFNRELFIQMIGTAMGTKPAPSYANIFMARKIDSKIGELSNSVDEENPVKFFKRFLDDIFMLFRGSLDSLHSFLEDLNNMHPTIKFTMSHTSPYKKENLLHHCGCDLSDSLAFLDSSCQIINKKIIVDLYRKPTDRNQYLLTSSCHPTHVTTNIPFSLALRIVRICTLPKDRDTRLTELRNMLIERDYKPGIIDAAIDRARQISRNDALKKVQDNKKNKRPVFVITHDPRLPSISGIVQKHWRTMVTDPHLKEVFPEPPLIAYKRPQNVREKIIRAKVPPMAPSRPKRNLPGMNKCSKGCPTCDFVKKGKKVTAAATQYTAEITTQVDCQTKNIVYCIGCKKCPVQYIGESDRSLQDRFAEHRGYVSNHHLNKATGQHFNLPGHRVSDMEVTILEKIISKDPQYRKTKEKIWIERFNTKYNGLNRKN